MILRRERKWKTGLIVAIVFLTGTALFHACKDTSTDSNGETAPPVPAISSISPTAGPPGITVTISGSGFSAAASDNKITFNGVLADVSSASTSSLEAVVPEDATTGAVEVTVAGQTAVGPNFDVEEQMPGITTVEPDSGSAGTPVTILGMNFDPSPSNNIVTFNGGVIAAVDQASDSSLATSVPEGAESGPIQVEVEGQKTLSPAFEVITPAEELPQVTGLSPDSGSVGTQVNISGKNFDPTPSDNIVTFNGGVISEVQQASDTALTTTVPEGAESGPIQVEVDGEKALSPSFTVLRDGTGTLEITASSTGRDGDRDGYILTLDTGEQRVLEVSGTAVFQVVSSGDHQLELTDVAGNCSVGGNNPRSVTISTGETTTTAFNVTCEDIIDIAFVSDRTGREEIWGMREDGSNVTQVTTGGGVEPHWSPDGTKIVFESDRTGDSEIWVIGPDGFNPTNLTNNPDPDYDPRWSPDGNSITFTSERKGDIEIWVMNPDGSNPVNLSQRTDPDSRPEWSPDGGQISYLRPTTTGDSDIWTMDNKGGNQTDLSALSSDPDSLDFQQRWSPDGKKIAFRSHRTGDPEIWVMNADGSNQTNLSTDPDEDVLPSWSPDGKQIAFLSNRSGVASVWVMKADGTNPTELELGAFGTPQWSQDGTRILYVEGPIGGNSNIWVMDSDGMNKIQLTFDTNGDINPRWRPL